MLTAFLLTIIYITFFKYRHIKIVKATAKKFIRHAEEHDINYRIEFIVKKSSDDMKIEEVWIDRKLYKFKITREASPDHVASFAEKENLKIDAFEVEQTHYAITDPPKRFNGAAMIGYRINNMKRYLSVSKIEFLPA
jgi:hypothetical protein